MGQVPSTDGTAFTSPVDAAVVVEGGQRSTAAPVPRAGVALSVDSLLATIASIAYARFRPDGVLSHANPCFLEIGGARVGSSTLTALVVEGQRDEVARLLGGGDLHDAPPNVHFDAGDKGPTTLLVTWARDGNELLLLGESPIVDLEATQAMLLKLNSRVSDLARENAKKSAELSEQNRVLQEARRTIEALSRKDPLTGLANRRWLDEVLHQEFERAKRHGVSLSVIMADLDHFKEINDTFGHVVGDQVLRSVGQVFEGAVRLTDVVGRYGGEEFLVLLPNTDLTAARALAERMLRGLRDMPVTFRSEPVSASFGVAEWTVLDSPAGLVARADEGLYEAKRGGRDRVATATPATATPGGGE